MSVSEEDVAEEERIQDDFQKAKQIYERIRKQFGVYDSNRDIVFALSLMYIRQLKHHKYEEEELLKK